MAYSTTVFVKYQQTGSPPPEMAAGGFMPDAEIAKSATGEYIPLPNVGDIIDCKNVGGAVVGQTNKYRVRARYLTYIPLTQDHCTVFLMIEDV